MLQNSDTKKKKKILSFRGEMVQIALIFAFKGKSFGKGSHFAFV